jgi:hypothetical protein
LKKSVYLFSSSAFSKAIVWTKVRISGENSISATYKERLDDYNRNQKLDFSGRKENLKLFEKLKNGCNGNTEKLFNAVIKSQRYKDLLEEDGGKVFSNKIFEKVLQEQCLNPEVLNKVYEVLQDPELGLGFPVAGDELVVAS